MHKAWGQIFSNHLYGDYVEFGIYKGESFLNSLEVFLEFKNWLKKQKNSNEAWRINIAKESPLNDTVFFHALDTFVGMPQNKENNFIYKEGNFGYSYEYFKKKLNKFNNKDLKVFIYKGEFRKTQQNFKENLKERKVSIVNFDCDLESSTTDALEIIKNNIQIGTIFFFDDYNAFNANMSLGQRKSFSDFIKKSNFIFEKFFNYHYSGQSFICIGQK